MTQYQFQKVSLDSQVPAVRLLVYGGTDAGKTYFAGTAAHAIYLDTENGYQTLRALPKVPRRIFTTETLAGVRQIIELVQNQREQITAQTGWEPEVFVLDTITMSQDWETLTIMDKQKDQEKFDYDVWRVLLLRGLRIMRPMVKSPALHILCLAQQREIEGRFMPAMRGYLGDHIGGYFDIVAYLEKIGTIRRLWFDHPDHLTRCRFPGFPKSIDNPTFQKVIDLVAESVSGDKEEPQPEPQDDSEKAHPEPTEKEGE